MGVGWMRPIKKCRPMLDSYSSAARDRDHECIRPTTDAVEYTVGSIHGGHETDKMIDSSYMGIIGGRVPTGINRQAYTVGIY